MPIAAAWYSATSASFWADIFAIAGIVATVAVGRMALPRRRLRCTIISRTRLMNAPQLVRHNLKVSYKDQELTDPYVVVLEIVGTGRSAIPSSSFDNGRSLQLGLASGIETILSTDYRPVSATKPVVEGQGSTVELKPELIARREIISISLLTDGDPGSLNVFQNPFTDVRLETADQEAAQKQRARWLIIATSVLAVLTLVTLGIGGYETYQSVNRSNALSGATLCVTLTEFDQAAELGMQLVNRDIIIDRTSEGAIKSIKFLPKYNSDVSTLEGLGQYLAIEYRAVGDKDSIRTAAEITQMLVVLPKLPHEGTGDIVNRGIAEFDAVMSQISNPPNPQGLGCAS